MGQVFQETLGGRIEKVVPKKGGWGSLHPHFAAPSPFPTSREVKKGMVNWDGLKRMCEAVRLVQQGKNPEVVAKKINPIRRLPGF